MNNMAGLVQVLADLAKINLERVSCYQKIYKVYASRNNELSILFTNKIQETERNVYSLIQLIASFGQCYSPLKMKEGAILQGWHQNKYKLRESCCKGELLGECEYGESAVLEAYQSALLADCVTDFTCRKIIMDQKYALQSFKILLNRLNDINAYLTLPRVFISR